MDTGAEKKAIAIERAAARIGADYADLLHFLLTNVQVSPALWSSWSTGAKSVAEKYLVRFLTKYRAPALTLEASAPIRSGERIAGAISALNNHGRPDLVEHLDRQAEILSSLVKETAAVRGQLVELTSRIEEPERQRGKLGGLKGGRARAQKLSAKRRRVIARKAAQARWAAQSGL